MQDVATPVSTFALIRGLFGGVFGLAVVRTGLVLLSPDRIPVRVPGDATWSLLRFGYRMLESQRHSHGIRERIRARTRRRIPPSDMALRGIAQYDCATHIGRFKPGRRRTLPRFTRTVIALLSEKEFAQGIAISSWGKAGKPHLRLSDISISSTQVEDLTPQVPPWQSPRR